MELKSIPTITLLALGFALSLAAIAGDGPAKPTEKVPTEKVPTEKVRVQFNIPYTDEREGARLADIYRPPSDESCPAILMIHGGAWIAGDKSFDTLHARQFANEGYVVMVINYRLAPAHKFPAQIDDCFEAIRWLVAHAENYRVDPDRIGVWGYSAGGHLAALVATNPRSGLPRVKACVAGGAPCDLRLLPDESSLMKGFLGGTRTEFPEVYDAASPIHHVSSDDPPMLLFHGESDSLVPIDFSLKMQERLQDHQVACELLKLENKTHIMAFVDKNAIHQSISFFDRHLKNLNGK